MSRIANLNLSESEVSQDIDLKKALGVDVSNNAPLKEAVGQWMIDRILERTASAKDAHGQPFAKYSAEYKGSLMYQAFKSSGKVNLELTGDMLSSIDILSDKGNTIRIGISDSEQAAKAYGHMTGMKGHPTLDGVAPARVFFGLTDKDLKDLKRDFTPDILNSDAQTAQDDSILIKLQANARKILGGFFGS